MKRVKEAGHADRAGRASASAEPVLALGRCRDAPAGRAERPARMTTTALGAYQGLTSALRCCGIGGFIPSNFPAS